MRKFYNAAEVEVIALADEDIVTASQTTEPGWGDDNLLEPDED